MSKYFFTHTRLSVIEREMVRIPGFEKKPPSPTTYLFPVTCEECRFREVPSSCHKSQRDHTSSCPFLLERMLAGDVPRLPTLHQARYGTVLLPETLFFHRKHRAFYHSLRHSITHTNHNRQETSVLYLMSYHDELYDRFVGTTVATALRNIPLSGLSSDSYCVLCLAKDILFGTHYIDPTDYTCPEIISHETAALAYGAFLILRHGVASTSPLRKCL